MDWKEYNIEQVVWEGFKLIVFMVTAIMTVTTIWLWVTP